MPSLPNRLPMLERILTESIVSPQTSQYRKRAQFTYFCGLTPEELAGYGGQLEVAGRCLEWFVFDYYIPEFEMTPAQHWFSLKGDCLSEADKIIAQDCLRYSLGIFKITHINANGFVVIDLFRQNQCYEVIESVLTQELSVGQLVLARLFPSGDKYALSGMASVMDAKMAQKMTSLIESGKIVPDDLLPHLDGLELENIFGRSLAQIDRMEDIDKLHERLKYYLEQICPGRLGFYDLLGLMEKCRDPFNIANLLCERLRVTCRHEMDLILAYSMATWFQTHKL